MSITLRLVEWAAVEAGESFSACGDGYDYEGETFQDHWHVREGSKDRLKSLTTTADRDLAGAGCVTPG